MRILFHTKDHPWKCDSGYAIAGKYMTYYLVEKHDVAVFAPVGNLFSMDYVDFTGYDGKQYNVPVYPGIRMDYDEDLVPFHYKDFKADIMLQMVEPWAISKIPEWSRKREINWVIIPPLDYLDPIPKHVIDRVKAAFRAVPWVMDAYKRLKDYGVENLMPPIPLGLNTKIWHPLDREKFPKLMKSVGWGYDTFNILFVAANQFLRKAWAESLWGIRFFMNRHPEVKVRIWLHTTPSSPEGWNMNNLLTEIGLLGSFKAVDPYEWAMGRYDETKMVQLFACADVVMNAGLEGFGYATIQAQACGTPVIGLNAGPTPELVKYGVLVAAAHTLLAPSLLVETWPDAKEIADALELLYLNRREKFAGNRQEAIDWVRETFSWEVVMKQWFKTLDEIDEALYQACLKPSDYPPKPSDRSLEDAKEPVVLL